MRAVRGEPVATNACVFYPPHAAAGASGARLSLRHLFLRAACFPPQLGRAAPREGGPVPPGTVVCRVGCAAFAGMTIDVAILSQGAVIAGGKRDGSDSW